jgi:hypothetical protein
LCFAPNVKRNVEESEKSNNDAVVLYDYLEDVIEKYPDEVISELLPEEFAKIMTTRQKKLNKQKAQKSKRDSKLILSDAKVPESFRRLR